MAVLRVGPLPEGALDAAARFHAEVVPEVLRLLDPPQQGEGDRRAQPGGGGVSPSATGDTPPSSASRMPPPLAGEDMVLVFPAAPHDHRGWRLAAVQDLARRAAPLRVNAVTGGNEDAIAEAIAYLERAPGITGQLLAVPAA